VCRLGRRVDPQPADLAAGAVAAFARRPVGHDLAVLTYDSLVDRDATPRRVRRLTFEGDLLTVLLEVRAGREVVGHLVPAAAARVALRWDGGSRVVAPDAYGRFSIADVPAGPVSVCCHARGRRPLTTDWIVV
jgi:hypothetical protein